MGGGRGEDKIGHASQKRSEKCPCSHNINTAFKKQKISFNYYYFNRDKYLIFLIEEKSFS